MCPINTCTPAMVSGMRTGYPHGLHKGLGSKFRDGSRLRQEGSRLRQEVFRVREGSRVQQEIPEEGRRAHRPKRCTDDNKDEDNCPNNPNNISYQTSSKKIREIVYITMNMRKIVWIIKIIQNYQESSQISEK